MGFKNNFMLVDARFPRGLRLIVDLKDNFTGSKPVCNIQVVFEDHTIKMIKNLSGYYLFFKVPAGAFHLRFQSEYYFTREDDVNIPELEPGTKHPVTTLTLHPKPCYPFPSGTTLIRGMVQDSQGNWLPGAIVRIEETTIETLTTARGEFACYYTGLGGDDVVVIDGKRYLKGGAAGTIPLRVSYHSLSGGVGLTDVPEGEVTVLTSPIILKE